MQFRKHFDYDVEAASNEAVLPADKIGESLTIQSQSVDADINEMMRRFGVTGKMPEGVRIPTFEDFSNQVGDYQSAMNAVLEAQDAFMEFPANVREKFKNSPQLMMEFCDSPGNWDEAKSLGILSEASLRAREAARAAAEAARRAELLEAAKAAGWAPKEPAPVVP